MHPEALAVVVVCLIFVSLALDVPLILNILMFIAIVVMVNHD